MTTKGNYKKNQFRCVPCFGEMQFFAKGFYPLAMEKKSSTAISHGKKIGQLLESWPIQKALEAYPSNKTTFVFLWF